MRWHANAVREKVRGGATSVSVVGSSSSNWGPADLGPPKARNIRGGASQRSAWASVAGCTGHRRVRGVCGSPVRENWRGDVVFVPQRIGR